MSNLPRVIEENPNVIAAEIIQQYEAAAGKTLYDAQSDRLMIDLIAYRESLARAAMNDAARQGLPQFAREPMLSYHGAFVNTYRLDAQPSQTTLQFTQTQPDQSAQILESGFRVKAPNESVFATDYEVVVKYGEPVQVKARADEPGAGNNGLLQNVFKEAFDDLPTGIEVTNLTPTNGGSDIEDIERFRKRILLAMARPSAGSQKAYLYTALSASILVVDVSIQVLSPGWVRLAVLANGDAAEVVALVDNAVQADDTRPTTDRVDTIAAVPVPIHASFIITPLEGSVLSDLQGLAEQAMQTVAQRLKTTLGYDSVDSQIISVLQALPGVKRVEAFGATQAIAPEEYAVLTWDLHYVGAEPA